MAANRMESTPGADASAAEKPAEAAPAAGGGFKAWLPLIITIVLMPVLAYGMTTFVLLPKLQQGLGMKGEAPAASAPKAKKTEAKGGKKENVTMNKLLVNVAGTMGARYLLVSLSIEGSATDFKDQMQAHDAQLRDMAMSALRVKTIADLEKPGAVNLIRTELLTGFNSILGDNAVEDIYVTEFAIQ
ncbi:MAG TPA: flagellar basal body-associated FliL family protein [Dongiaceae bacterium]|nr:flagellar basal body-associated FliL family protein [Dongiaceae bacterium]